MILFDAKRLGKIGEMFTLNFHYGHSNF